MGLSRRMFTREFKLAAIEQLETGVSVAGVARAFEVHPSLLQRWQQEFCQAPATAFLGPAAGTWSRTASRNWSARWANRRWRLIF